MIVVFGTICLDRMRRVPRLPGLGGYVEVEAESAHLGGEAANTANALNAWEDRAVLVGNALGEGPDAEQLRGMIAERGLAYEVAGTPPSPMRTPVCDVYLTPDGERTMFGLGFSKMEPELGEGALPLVAGAWFTAEPNMELASRQAIRMAQAAGMRTYLMDFIREDDPVGPGAFWQCSTDWAGHRQDPERNVAWVREFVDRTGAFAILSDGPRGFVAGSPDLPVRAYPPFPAPSMVDTTGAGDLFRAGMLHGLSRNWPIGQCLRFAAAAGALKCGYLGATTQVPTVAEIEALIHQHPLIASEYV
ncbi:MAG: carbohydrate kinase family protein [Fimbriimonas sp.]